MPAVATAGHSDGCVPRVPEGGTVAGQAGQFLAPLSPEQASDADAEREAILAEPLLPAPSTPGQDWLVQQHAAMVAGLLAAAAKPSQSAEANPLTAHKD